MYLVALSKTTPLTEGVNKKLFVCHHYIHEDNLLQHISIQNIHVLQHVLIVQIELPEFDKELRRSLSETTNYKLSEYAWTQACLPVHSGGLCISGA